MYFFSAVMGDIVKKKPGESVTIRCSSNVKRLSFELKKGLRDETQIVYWDLGDTGTITYRKPRVTAEEVGHFTLHVTLSNLTVDDTGVYLCMYTDMRCGTRETRGGGSIFLDVQRESTTH